MMKQLRQSSLAAGDRTPTWGATEACAEDRDQGILRPTTTLKSSQFLARHDARRRAAPVQAMLAIATMLLAFTGRAMSEEALVPGTNAWTLSHDSGDPYCFVYAFYPRSNTGLTFASDGASVRFGLFSADWNLPENTTYWVRMRFDGRRWTTAEFTAINEAVIASDLYTSGEREFRQSAGVEIYGEKGNLVGTFDLAGSSKAIDYVRNCGLLAVRAARKNPFEAPADKVSASRSHNPFD